MTPSLYAQDMEEAGAGAATVGAVLGLVALAKLAQIHATQTLKVLVVGSLSRRSPWMGVKERFSVPSISL